MPSRFVSTQNAGATIPHTKDNFECGQRVLVTVKGVNREMGPIMPPPNYKGNTSLFTV